VRLVIARCQVDYVGRLTAHLPMAPRLLLVKADGSVSIHADDRAYKPLNWMSPPCSLKDELTDGALVPQAGSAASPADGVETVPLEVALAFHPRTLGQLLFVRTTLRLDDRTDRFLAAAVTGILHGKSASYLSELMPNTFSMAPRYVREFAARTEFASPDRDVFDGLSKKLDRLFRQAPPSIEGIALLGDARDVAPRARSALRARGRADRARLVVTSPPYLRVVKYGYYNWLRTWFLGFDARAIDATLDDAHHREPYLVFLRDGRVMDQTAPPAP